MTTVNNIARSLDLEEVRENRFQLSNLPSTERGVVFGGQLLAQMIVAAEQVQPAKFVKSAHVIFSRPTVVSDAVELLVEPYHAGRSFASASTTVYQGGQERARGLLLLTSPDADLIRNSVDAPDVPAPSGLSPSVDLVEGRETRYVDSDIADSDAVGEPVVNAWVKYPDVASGSTRSRALIAHASASHFIAAALRPHKGLAISAAHATISTAVLSHTVSFHEDFDVRDWTLISARNVHAGHGRAFGVGHAFTEAGVLVASFSQESLVRKLDEDALAERSPSTFF